MTKKIKKIKKIAIPLLLACILAGGGYYLFKNKGNAVQFKTEKVARGDLRATVTATGTVSAVTTVLVGTQVSGTVKELLVDFNSPVKKGQLLAQIDPALPEAKVSQARANLQSAEAGVEKAVAVLQDANRTLDRNRTLWDRKYIARSDLDTSETNQQSAQAQLSVAKAQVGQARAALQQEETNLQYTRILSPVDGVVISRNVDVGQTVAASFQTPTLFSIAQDLTRMQIDTNVDEADIGRIKVANPELKLKPGMTANVSIITALEKDVLKVPNAAIRFKWQPAGANSEKGSAKGAAGAGRSKAEVQASTPKTQGVWVFDGEKPRRVPLTLGINDGNNTAVISGELKEGDAVIVEATGQTKKGASQTGGPRFF
jgi:HlyD family secretion protein